MKKVLFAAIALALLISCKKQAPDPSAPTITWEANPDFAIQEMGDQMDGTILVKAPTGIAALSIKCVQLPELCKLRATEWIGIQAYKSALTMDLISDTQLAAHFAAQGAAVPVGGSLSKSQSCTLDFKALLDALCKDLVLQNGVRFDFVISVTDPFDKMVSKTVSFRWTAAATFPENIPSYYQLRKNDTRTLELSITIPGKVAEFTLSFGGANADAKILEYICNRSASGTAVIDLVKDTNVKQAFDLDPVVKNAAMVNLKLTSLMRNLGYECGSTDTSTNLQISIKDALGKVSTHTITLDMFLYE